MYVARLTAPRLLGYYEAIDATTGAERTAAQLRFAVVNADGSPAFGADDDAADLDGEVVLPLLALFYRENGMVEKKRPTDPASASAASPPASA